MAETMDERYRRFRATFYAFKTVDEEIAFLEAEPNLKPELRELLAWLKARQALVRE